MSNDEIVNQPWLVYGAGNMASAVIAGLYNAGVSFPRMTAYRAGNRLDHFAVTKIIDSELLAPSKVLMLGVKPQIFGQFFESIKPLVTNDTVVISLMAGWTCQALAQKLDAKRVLRVMPNMAVANSDGALAMVGHNISDQEFDGFVNLFGQLGELVVMPDETDFEICTALIGSLPAFIYQLASDCVASASSKGLSAEDAERLVRQVFASSGATLTAQNLPNGDDFASLIAKIRSPGGTTQAGLETMSGRSDVLIDDILTAAKLRGEELSRN